MEKTKSKSKYYLLFIFWLAIIVFLLATPDFRQWFWLALPGTCTYLAYSLDLID
ncbi:MAG TPA: hypothetical protein PLY81_00105 [Chitinophagaceae bacterium]|nr:hypothetical protein [Chitinophagaceae bacterium]MCC6633990.1 hypothetical protein [Chitinophagaceae bacterium]HNE93659.1 hypothetical protein [Chitinophagaceae bacterium]HNF28660.1 hypothetical protein [Chitinophagaceae bacterium]HNJ57894.1 hypothetical protein [Chitinophagaceae bacterium]